MIVERRVAVDRVDQRDHAVEPEGLHESRMAHDRLQHGRRVCKPGRLDDDAPQGRDAPGLHAVDQIGQRIDEVAADRAAQASVRELDDAVGRLLDEQVVDGDVAELVDDDGGVGEGRVLQQAVEQRRLAGAEEAGQDRNGDRRLHQPASAELPSIATGSVPAGGGWSGRQVGKGMPPLALASSASSAGREARPRAIIMSWR